VAPHVQCEEATEITIERMSFSTADAGMPLGQLN
jgi:hypothetical protein